MRCNCAMFRNFRLLATGCSQLCQDKSPRPGLCPCVIRPITSAARSSEPTTGRSWSKVVCSSQPASASTIRPVRASIPLQFNQGSSEDNISKKNLSRVTRTEADVTNCSLPPHRRSDYRRLHRHHWEQDVRSRRLNLRFCGELILL